MIQEYGNIKYLTKQEETEFIKACTNVQYKFMATLMLDTGIRVSECLNLRVGDFDFQKMIVVVKTLKQRIKEDAEKKAKKVKTRILYLTQRCLDAAAEYFKKLNKKLKPDDIVFPPKSKFNEGETLTRKQVWRYFKKVSNGKVHPHMLRHTCATKLAESAKTVSDLVTVRDILGHANVETTNIYIHASENRKREAAKSLEDKNQLKEFVKKIFPSLFPKRLIHVLPTTEGRTTYHIGRKRELETLVSLAEKKVNVLLIGEQGTGKSHLLDNYKAEKVLRIDDTKEFKKTLANMLMQIIEDSETIDKVARDEEGEPIFIKSSKEIALELLGVKRDVITRQSAKRLCELMTQITAQNEYTIIIDAADTQPTPSVVKSLEFLRNHFHFIVAARRIGVNYASWLTNFQKLELKNLNRPETLELIARASNDFRANIEDYEMFKNHVWEKTNGNPQFCLEMIDRFRKEPYVSREIVANIEHTASRKEIDMLPVFVALLASLMIFRYIAGELGGEDAGAFRLIGGGALLVALFGRKLIGLTKQKYI